MWWVKQFLLGSPQSPCQFSHQHLLPERNCAELVAQWCGQGSAHGEGGASDPAMLRSSLRASLHWELGNRHLIRTSTAVPRRAGLRGSVPDCTGIRRVHPLQLFGESRPNAHTTDATDNGSLATPYYGYLIVRLYEEDRTHLGLEKDTPTGRIRSLASGHITVRARLGGLHHRYDRAA